MIWRLQNISIRGIVTGLRTERFSLRVLTKSNLWALSLGTRDATCPAMNDTPTDPEAALRKKLERENKWRRKLASRRDRLWAWIDMVFLDHAFFRMVYLNLHQISEGVWRAAQPLPGQIRRLSRRGIKTIVNLRGGQSYGSLPLEQEACEKHGIAFENFILRSRALPSIEEIHELRALLERIEYPALFHCKSGADRAGIMSALYLALHEGRPVAEARKQLSIWYGHFSRGPTGVLDAMFDAYEADQPDGKMPLMEWIDTRYDPDAITAAFKAGTMSTFLTEIVLRRE